MARYILKNILIEEIDSVYPFQVRYDLQDPALVESIRKRGLIEPVKVLSSSGKKKQLVSGHKRVEAAKSLGLRELSALEIQGNYLPDELFLFSILSNWRQDFSDFDKAWILFRGKTEFKITAPETQKELLSLLSLPDDVHLFEEAEKMMRLHPELLNCFAKKDLPFRGARGLTRFTANDQLVFAREIGARVHLTTNQLIQLSDWLFDLLKMTKKPLAAILQDELIVSVLQHSGTDSRQKGEAFIAAVKGLRYPKLTGREEKLKRLTGQLRADFPDMSIEAPASFEAEGFSLKLRIRKPESLDQALDAVKSKRNVLNSLFDFML